MTQRKAYKYALVPDGSDRGRPLFKFVEVQIPGLNLPTSSRHGNRISRLETESTVRHRESGNGNSIFRPQEVSL